MRRIVATCLLVASSVALATHSPSKADEWSRFRGPNGTGVSAGTGLPVEFGPSRGVVWSTEVPFGRSSPALTPNRIFLTAVEGDHLVTMALDRDTGQQVWRREAEPAHTAELHAETDSSTSSPVTDGTNVYVFFHELGLVSYDAEGNERWRRELGEFRNFYGIASSPILAGDALIFVADQVSDSFIVALDAATGTERWRQQRPVRAESYSTPLLYPEAAVPTEVVILGSTWIDSYDLKTGEVLWSLPGVGAGPVASPVLDGDLLFVSAPDHAPEPMPPFSSLTELHDADGDQRLSRDEVAETWMKGHFGFVDGDADGWIEESDWDRLRVEMTSDHWGVYGIRLGSNDNPPEILWNLRQSVPYIPTPLLYRDVLYIVKDSIVTAVEPRTGKVHKRGRLGRQTGKVYASPVGGDGKVYMATVDGKVVVLSAGPEWEILATNDMGDQIYATPAIAGGDLYVRTRGSLYRLAAESAAAATGSAH